MADSIFQKNKQKYLNIKKISHKDYTNISNNNTQNVVSSKLWVGKKKQTENGGRG
jgi:hypothetical protein